MRMPQVEGGSEERGRRKKNRDLMTMTAARSTASLFLSIDRTKDGMCKSPSVCCKKELAAVGLEETLLINSKCSSKKATTLQTVKMPRSNVLDRVQSFLPQMAHANDELRRKMVTAPAHQFDIENVDSATEKVIEMNVAVVELNDSDIDEEILTSEDDSESEDDYITDEVTIDNIKFPKQKGEKGKIEILDSKANE
ncbi:NOP protein chaperone 1 isoform X2 [Falco cherrug]|uniref:NOP protein chaperone 1 isoform X2 n=1 Tax=Falco cherrug TaxID=345164 RepID=UPI0024790348|nr:NOP protein chaperone 1 isoform X2 [Falco cherrug]